MTQVGELIAVVAVGLAQSTAHWLLCLAMAAVFLFSAQDKCRHWSLALEEVRAAHLPWPKLALAGTVAVQAFGGLALISPWPQLVATGALALASFTVVATLQFHRFWAVPAAARTLALTSFLEHVAIVGGLLLLAAYQVGGLG